MRECTSQQVASVLLGQHCRRCGKMMRLSSIEPAVEPRTYIYAYECGRCGYQRTSVEDNR